MSDRAKDRLLFALIAASIAAACVIAGFATSKAHEQCAAQGGRLEHDVVLKRFSCERLDPQP